MKKWVGPCAARNRKARVTQELYAIREKVGEEESIEPWESMDRYQLERLSGD